MSEQDFNRIFAHNLSAALSSCHMTQAELAKRMKVSTATVSNWCKGVKLPRMEKVDRLCSILDIRRSDLMEDQSSSGPREYYFNEDARDMAQFLYENPDYRVLFDASRRVRKEDIEFVREMIDRLSGS